MGRYRISLNSMRAHYYFLAAQGAPIIQGRPLIKGVHYFLPIFPRPGISLLKGYLVSKTVKYTHFEKKFNNLSSLGCF